MSRVENAVGTGMADVEACLDGSQTWIELKCETRPSDPSTKIKARFQPSQIPWLKKRIKAGGRAFVLLQVGKGHDAERYLIPGDAAEILARGATEDKIKRLAILPGDATALEIVEAASTYD